MNKLLHLLSKKNKNLLSVFFTAGYPEIDSTVKIIRALEQSGADLLELGIPFSDPVADGPVIQDSSNRALKNGMSIKRLFDQLEEAEGISIPVLLMGYYNPVLQFGIENFCSRCKETGVDGIIIPDMPLEEYVLHRDLFRRSGLNFIFLVTPGTKRNRLESIAQHAGGFIYAVSSNTITGSTGDTLVKKEYIEEVVKVTGLPVLIGFGVKDSRSFSQACNISSGAIIGSAFIRALEGSKDIEKTVHDFIIGIRGINQ